MAELESVEEETKGEATAAAITGEAATIGLITGEIRFSFELVVVEVTTVVVFVLF